MNIFQRVRAWRHGSASPATPEAITYSSGDNDLRNRLAQKAGTPRPSDPNRTPAHCPECGSQEARAEWNQERTSFLLSCPDCGLSQRTELLASEDESPLAWRHGH